MKRRSYRALVSADDGSPSAPMETHILKTADGSAQHA